MYSKPTRRASPLYWRDPAPIEAYFITELTSLDGRGDDNLTRRSHVRHDTLSNRRLKNHRRPAWRVPTSASSATQIQLGLHKGLIGFILFCFESFENGEGVLSADSPVVPILVAHRITVGSS